MMPFLSPGLLQEDRRRSLAAACEWGLERCHSEESRSILGPLLALLSPFYAVVLPVRHPIESAPAVDFRVTLTDTSEPEARRYRFALSSEGELHEATVIALAVDAAACLRDPWPEAARLVGTMLGRITAAISDSKSTAGSGEASPTTPAGTDSD